MRSGKTDVLLNLIEKQPNIDKIYLHSQDPSEEKYQYLINIRESTGLKQFNDPKAKWYARCLQKYWWIQYQ